LALGISPNRIGITVLTTETVRTTARFLAQVRLFSVATESADQLLTRIRQQLNDSTSEIRRQNLTSQLNENSIRDVQTFFQCDSGVLQNAPCIASSNSLLLTLLAAIIPSVVGVILITTAVIFIILYMKKRPRKTPMLYYDRY
jgi:hypothetical protein